MVRGAAGLRVLCCAALLWVAGCTGTEHALFANIDPPPVVPPPTGGRPGMDAGGGAGTGADAAEIPREIMDAAVHLPDAGSELDPDVKFVWKETLPGKGTCREGLYLGQFSCEPPADAPLGERIAPFSGQVIFTLERLSREQAQLEIKGGKLDADWLGLILGGVSVDGTLLCSAGYQFDAITAPNADGSDPWSPVLGSFRAKLSGSLDEQKLIISGTFELEAHLDTDQPMRCDGTFEANAAP
jgi:hypothetical protein